MAIRGFWIKNMSNKFLSRGCLSGIEIIFLLRTFFSGFNTFNHLIENWAKPQEQRHQRVNNPAQKLNHKPQAGIELVTF